MIGQLHSFTEIFARYERAANLKAQIENLKALAQTPEYSWSESDTTLFFCKAREVFGAANSQVD